MELVYMLESGGGSSLVGFHALGEPFSGGLGGVVNRIRPVHLCAT